MSKTRIIIVTGLLLLAIGHAGMMMLYSFRSELAPRLGQVADDYCVPLFYQNWKLFAPDVPAFDAQLEYRVQQMEGWSSWSDVTGHAHSYGRAVYETIEQGLLAELLWQVRNNLYTANDTLRWDAVLSSQAYAAATYYVYKMEAYRHQPTPAASQLRIVYRPTPAMGNARQQLEGYQMLHDTLVFPIYHSSEP